MKKKVNSVKSMFITAKRKSGLLLIIYKQKVFNIEQSSLYKYRNINYLTAYCNKTVTNDQFYHDLN